MLSVSESKKKWALVFALAIIPLLGWWLAGLFDLDEGFYGAAVAEMNRRGEWITPYYNGQPWFEKPILLYWFAKPSLALFGIDFGLRLPSVLATLGLYGLVGWFVNRRFGDVAARASVCVLATSLMVAALGRLMMTDALLNLCLTGGLLLFWESLVGERRWRLLAAVLLGFSVLAKGPYGLLLFVPIVGYTFYREPQLRAAYRGWWLLGTVLLAAVVAAWYVPADLASKDLFVQKFLIEQNLQRFQGGDKAHTLPAWSIVLYVPILFLGMAPWSWFVKRAWPRRGTDTGEQTALKRFLATWAVVIFAFFSISGAKLPHYILPCIAPLAILIGVHFAEGGQFERVWRTAWTTGVLLFALFCSFSMFWYEASLQTYLHAIAKRLAPLHQPVVLFGMGRQNADRGTGTLQLQETSHPSVLAYLNSTALETSQFEDLLSQKGEVWVIAPYGRIGDKELAMAKANGVQAEFKNGYYYQLFLFRR